MRLFSPDIQILPSSGICIDGSMPGLVQRPYPSSISLDPTALNLSGWLGADTWAAVDGKLVNTPALGPELFSNAGFETLGGGGEDVFASWSEFVYGSTSIADETAIVHEGAHSAKIIGDADNSNCYLQQAVVLPAYVWVRFAVMLRSSEGGATGQMAGSQFGNRLLNLQSIDAFTEFYMTGMTSGANGMWRILRYALADKSIYLDTASLKVMTLKDLIAARFMSVANVVASVQFSRTPGAQGGLVIGADPRFFTAPDEAGHQNFILVYNEAEYLKVTEFIEGVPTNKISAGYTYGDYKTLRVQKENSTTIRLFYDGAELAVVSTFTPNMFTCHGILSTSPDVKLGSLSITPYTGG